MTPRKILSLFLLICTTPVFAFRSQYIIPDGPIEDALLNSYQNVTPVEAALAASGIPEVMFASYTAEFRRWENEIRASLPRRASQYQIAEAILNYIHAKVFTRYQANTTTLMEVFQGGLFNCLSATVVNGLLLQAFGIEVRGVVLPTHVYLLATLDGRPTEIENTIAQGLLIAQDKALQNQFNTLTGFDYGGNSRKVVISWPETVGILYSNRSYFNAQNRQYEQAFQNMMKAQSLLASASSEQSNLTAGYLNYSYVTFQRENRPAGDYLRVLEILQEGINRYPQQTALRANYTRGVGILLQHMITNGTQDEEIDQFMEQSRPYMIQKDYTALVKNRYPQQVSYYLRTVKDFPTAKKILISWFQRNPQGKDERSWVRTYCYELIQAELRSNSSLTPNIELLESLKEFPFEITGELYGHYYSELARRLFNAKKYEEAVATMESGLSTVGEEPYITENGFAMAVNSAVVYFNQRRYEEALGYYKRALAFKDSTKVTQDMAAAYGNLAAQAYNNQDFPLAKRWVAEGLTVVPKDRRLQEIQAQL